MDKVTIRSDRPKFQTGLNWILLLLSLVAIGAIFFIGPDTLLDFSVSLRSQLMANYGADSIQLSIKSLQLSIIEDILRDLGFATGGDGLDAELGVPVASATPLAPATEQENEDTPTPDASGSGTPTISPTPTPSPQPTLTSTKTLVIWTDAPDPTRPPKKTNTPKPTNPPVPTTAKPTEPDSKTKTPVPPTQGDGPTPEE